MVDHVKLEIAIQLVAEKIAEIYKKIDSANDEKLIAEYNSELENAYDEKEKVARGELDTINKILSERSGNYDGSEI